MPLQVDDVTYFSVNEVLASLGISRVTLWRWRAERKVPQGGRLRNRLVFSSDELEAIRQYAVRVEPIDPAGDDQLRLFGLRTY